MTIGGDGRQPRWYQDAVLYELHVRAFRDSDDDGIGDFQGLIQGLDYVRDLGVTALWLLPFYPSPLRDDGYDIADYTAVHPAYGTLADFEVFLGEAHGRGLRVITELVLNHTSDEHPWFRRARQAPPGSPERDFYVWSETPDRFREARVIFSDFEPSNWTWDPVAEAYFWHRFYAHQPDLNFGNPAVRRAIFEVVDFWLGMGVDGLRLDAVPYLHEADGTPSENLPGTHAFLKELRRHVDARFPDRVILAEANQWPEDAAAYFGDGDECHMAFHFPLMPRLFMAIDAEDRFPIVDILAQTPNIPESCQWALFLRNHDELTLEMVTDEERLTMYRAFARDPEARVNLGIRRRLAPLMRNNRRQIELMNGLLFSLPGTPVLYYGDEIGMGDNVYLGDRNGVRTPMQWAADRNAGFSRAHPQRLYLPLVVDHEFHHETVHVEAQQQNPHSLLHFMRQLIAQRRRHPALGHGALEVLDPDNPKVLAFLRRDDRERLLVVANLSRFAQHAELDLRPFAGLVPIELSGRSAFPPIGDEPYPLTLGPHAFYWFALEPEGTGAAEADAAEAAIALPTAADSWEDLVLGEGRAALEAALPGYLRRQPWFGGKARRILSVAIDEAVAVPCGTARAFLAFVRVAFAEGESHTYLLPLGFAADSPNQPWTGPDRARIAGVRQGAGEEGVLVDALWLEGFCEALLEVVSTGRRRLVGSAGTVAGQRTPAYRAARGPASVPLRPSPVDGDLNNTTVLYGDRLLLKLFRRLEEGVHPEWEIGQFLTECRFPHAPPVAGALEYRPGRGAPTILGVLQGVVPDARDAWQHTVDAAAGTFERALASAHPAPATPPPTADALLAAAGQATPPWAEELMGAALGLAELLGRRTAELHRALATGTDDPAFAPQPLTPMGQRALYQSMRGLAGRVVRGLRRQAPGLLDRDRVAAAAVLEREEAILAGFRPVLDPRAAGAVVRCHGDFHLGQVVLAGDDVAFVDFEGEPARPAEERRLRRSPLRDIAGMLRSFHYAAEGARSQGRRAGEHRDEPHETILEELARAWQFWASVAFLGAYLREADAAPYLPAGPGLGMLLDAFLLEKAVYEVGYELDNRPDRVGVPLRGVLQVLASAEA